MKKVVLLVLTIAFLVSCGSMAVVKEATQTMKGNWQLTSVTYPGENENLQVSLFNDVPSRCLENSSWRFISNNNTGSYELSGLGCESSSQFFIWSIKVSDATAGTYDLMFKPTDANYKSTTGNQGYRINLKNLSGDQMVWEQTINFEGRPFPIQMNFTKL